MADGFLASDDFQNKEIAENARVLKNVKDFKFVTCNLRRFFSKLITFCFYDMYMGSN